MNVFVLSTGRCGSRTFPRASGHARNYTAAHESFNRWRHQVTDPPYHSLRYPENHIEVDNRLSWFLGALEKEDGDGAFYVHLLRDREEVARSLAKRGKRSILFTFAWGVLQYYDDAEALGEQERYQIGLQYWQVVNDNIAAFLAGKSRQMTIWLHDVRPSF